MITGLRHRLSLVLLGLLAASLPIAWSQDPESIPAADSAALLSGTTVAARKADLLQFYASAKPQNPLNAKASISYYVARILLGIEPADAASQWEACSAATLKLALARNAKNPTDNATLDPFDKIALLQGWLTCKHDPHVSTELASNVRAYIAQWRHKVWKGYGALNYRLMSDGSGFIAAEQWPDLHDADGLNAEEIKAATKARLLGYFNDTVRRNFHEYGSPTYAGVDYSAVKMLADFAQDPEVRTKAALTLDWMLLNVACGWNQGYHVAPAARAKYLGSTITSIDAMDSTAAIGWIYFGAPRPARGPGGFPALWFACPGSYDPPELFSEVANDRAKPFIHRGAFAAGKTDIRFTIYHTPAYSLASEWEFLSGTTDGHYKESRRQMLKWVSDKPFSTFAPMQENARRPYALQEHVANTFGYGENPFGQSLQHEGTLIGIIAVPDSYPYYKLYVPFPTTGSIKLRTERDGWICCHTGSMLFAFRTLAPTSWGKPREREQCDVLYSDARRNGWILETSLLKPFAGGTPAEELDRFANAVATRTKITGISLELPTPSFQYRSLDGHDLQITYRPHGTPYTDQHRVDGKPVDYRSFGLLENPWVNQKLGDETLTILRGSQGLRYDFKNWTRTTTSNP